MLALKCRVQFIVLPSTLQSGQSGLTVLDPLDGLIAYLHTAWQASRTDSICPSRDKETLAMCSACFELPCHPSPCSLPKIVQGKRAIGHRRTLVQHCHRSHICTCTVARQAASNCE